MSATDAMQEYLAEAYRIAYYQMDDPYVSTSALAKVLNVSPPAVTRMVQRLRDAGYLDHEPYRGIRLTRAGEHLALMNIRRHRLVERFLVDVMHFGWHQVHGPADELGAVVSDVVVNRMEQMAGFPKRCPHGEPIPTAAGVMPRIKDYPLADAEVGSDLVVSRVNTHDGEKLQYLDTLGIKPGVPLHVSARAPFNGPLQLRLNGTEALHHIGHELAGVLRVCTAEEFAQV